MGQSSKLNSVNLQAQLLIISVVLRQSPITSVVLNRPIAVVNFCQSDYSVLAIYFIQSQSSVVLYFNIQSQSDYC